MNKTTTNVYCLGDVPPDIICPFCNLIVEDAIMTPCCARGLCSSCAKERLIRDEKRCMFPTCKRVSTIKTLIPYHQLRKKVENYYNEHPGVEDEMRLERGNHDVKKFGEQLKVKEESDEALKDPQDPNALESSPSVLSETRVDDIVKKNKLEPSTSIQYQLLAVSSEKEVTTEAPSELPNSKSEKRKVCVMCQELGHITKKCPLLKEVCCKSCGIKGHVATQCTLGSTSGEPINSSETLDKPTSVKKNLPLQSKNDIILLPVKKERIECIDLSEDPVAVKQEVYDAQEVIKIEEESPSCSYAGTNRFFNRLEKGQADLNNDITVQLIREQKLMLEILERKLLESTSYASRSVNLKRKKHEKVYNESISEDAFKEQEPKRSKKQKTRSRSSQRNRSRSNSRSSRSCSPCRSRSSTRRERSFSRKKPSARSRRCSRKSYSRSKTRSRSRDCSRRRSKSTRPSTRKSRSNLRPRDSRHRHRRYSSGSSSSCTIRSYSKSGTRTKSKRSMESSQDCSSNQVKEKVHENNSTAIREGIENNLKTSNNDGLIIQQDSLTNSKECLEDSANSKSICSKKNLNTEPTVTLKEALSSRKKDSVFKRLGPMPLIDSESPKNNETCTEDKLTDCKTGDSKNDQLKSSNSNPEEKGNSNINRDESIRKKSSKNTKATNFKDEEDGERKQSSCVKKLKVTSSHNDGDSKYKDRNIGTTIADPLSTPSNSKAEKVLYFAQDNSNSTCSKGSGCSVPLTSICKNCELYPLVSVDDFVIPTGDKSNLMVMVKMLYPVLRKEGTTQTVVKLLPFCKKDEKLPVPQAILKGSASLQTSFAHVGVGGRVFATLRLNKSIADASFKKGSILGFAQVMNSTDFQVKIWEKRSRLDSHVKLNQDSNVLIQKGCNLPIQVIKSHNFKHLDSCLFVPQGFPKIKAQKLVFNEDKPLSVLFQNSSNETILINCFRAGTLYHASAIWSLLDLKPIRKDFLQIGNQDLVATPVKTKRQHQPPSRDEAKLTLIYQDEKHHSPHKFSGPYLIGLTNMPPDTKWVKPNFQHNCFVRMDPMPVFGGKYIMTSILGGPKSSSTLDFRFGDPIGSYEVVNSDEKRPHCRCIFHCFKAVSNYIIDSSHQALNPSLRDNSVTNITVTSNDYSCQCSCFSYFHGVKLESQIQDLEILSEKVACNRTFTLLVKNIGRKKIFITEYDVVVRASCLHNEAGIAKILQK